MFCSGAFEEAVLAPALDGLCVDVSLTSSPGSDRVMTGGEASDSGALSGSCSASLTKESKCPVTGEDDI